MQTMTTDDLMRRFGRPVAARTMARWLGIDPRTLAKYAARWGGIEIYPGRWLFFENRIADVLEINNADHYHEARSPTLAGRGDGIRSGEDQVVPGRQPRQRARGRDLGRGDARGAGHGNGVAAETDNRHGLVC
jgi:hypothetical protein